MAYTASLTELAEFSERVPVFFSGERRHAGEKTTPL
jgi:hypothetical protein